MSYIVALVLKDNKIYIINSHFRTVEKLLSNPRLLKILKTTYCCDAGYLIVDFDRKSVINCQDALNLQTIPFLKKFDVFEVK